jgi:hypothetical protein
MEGKKAEEREYGRRETDDGGNLVEDSRLVPHGTANARRAGRL